MTGENETPRRGRPPLTDEQRAAREARRLEKWEKLTPDSHIAKTRLLTWLQINHLARQYRGYGFDRNHFKVLQAQKAWKTYLDHGRNAPTTGRPIEKFRWPEVKAYIDRSITVLGEKRAG